MELIFASSNPHKLTEIRSIMPLSFKIISMAEAGLDEDIPETGKTLAENAALKAEFVFKKLGKTCFADDSGLEVAALNNEPGVYSARYAGLPVNHQKNISTLLQNLNGITDRQARFKTVIALHTSTKVEFFEGTINGKIALETTGTNGFGYDPVFIPDGFDKTFAEMTNAEKNSISHRAVAMQKLRAFLVENKF